MTRKCFAGAFLAFALVACAGPPPEPPAPPPLDPTGSYAFTAEVEGMVMTGTLTIEGAEGAYTGTLTSDDGTPPISISSVVVVDQSMTIEASGPMGPLSIEVVVSADGVADGSWSMGGMSGGFSATKN